MIIIRQIKDKNIYLFKITDEVTNEGVEKFINFLATKADADEKIKMIGVMESIPGFENFKVFVELMKLKAKAISVVEKYAIMTNKEWIENIVPIGNFFTPGMPIKKFKLDQENSAIEWLDKT